MYTTSQRGEGRVPDDQIAAAGADVLRVCARTLQCTARSVVNLRRGVSPVTPAATDVLLVPIK